MRPTTLTQKLLWLIPLLAALFLLTESLAATQNPTPQPTPQPTIGNAVSAPMPPSSCPLSLETGPKGDIRDIRGPIHIPDPHLWFFYALGGILLILLAWAIWKWFHKRQSLRTKQAFEIAFEELEKAKALMQPEMAEKFSVVVSRTIRTYIENRFGMKVTRKTTHEFITQVAAEPAGELNLHNQPLREFLDHCDLAKFARQTFNHEQMKRMFNSAWQFVEKTQPQPIAAGGK